MFRGGSRYGAIRPQPLLLTAKSCKFSLFLGYISKFQHLAPSFLQILDPVLMFFVVLLIVSWNKSSKRLGFCLLKIGISLIVHNQYINKGHGLALTNIMVMEWDSFSNSPLLTGGNWQKWKRVFLTCPCHEIYRDEAVGLKSCKNTWKITIFVKMWNLGQNRENLIFCQ